MREDKHGKIKVMMELDTPEELLDVIVNRVEQQIAEKKKVAKEATEKMKQLEKGAIEKKKKGNKEGTEKRKQPEKGALEKTIKDFERYQHAGKISQKVGGWGWGWGAWGSNQG